MLNRLKKLLLNTLILMIISFNIGCNDIQVDQIKEQEADNEEDQIISAEDFMAFYDISQEEVPIDYVESFIWEYRLPQKIKQDGVKWGEKAILAYKTGKPMGEDLGSLFHGPISELKLNEYIKNADIILFDFNMRLGNELYSPSKMIIDLKNKMIYFTYKETEKYKESEMCAELSDEDVQRIREELPKHIVEGNGVGSNGVSNEYSFIINMKAADYSTKAFSGDCGDEEHFPGFDEYWKELYRQCFDEEYQLSDND